MVKQNKMNQGRKNSSFKSSSRIAFWSMLLLLVITFFISIKSNAQKVAYTDVPGVSAWKTHWIREDKALHVFSCMSLSMIGTATAYDFKFKNPELAGLGLALSVGIAKEFLMDDKPDAYDLTADITGAFIGVGIIKLSQIIKKERRFNRYNPKLIKYGGN